MRRTGSRGRATAVALTIATAVATTACSRPSDAAPDGPGEARLSASPAAGVDGLVRPGILRLDLSDRRDAFLYVPEGFESRSAWPLIVSLHRTGGNARDSLRLFRAAAADEGAIVLALASRRAAWDASTGAQGADAVFLDRALRTVFDRVPVDAERIALAGFSTGASYALSIGLVNGDLFTHLIALSPGYVAGGEYVGRPEIFIAHGTRDRVVPIRREVRQIVPALRRDGYDVAFVEFEGTHRVDPDVVARAARWFVANGLAS